MVGVVGVEVGATVQLVGVRAVVVLVVGVVGVEAVVGVVVGVTAWFSSPSLASPTNHQVIICPLPCGTSKKSWSGQETSIIEVVIIAIY